MVTVLLGNAMNLLWHDHSLSWTEPIASSIAFVLGGLSARMAAAVFYVSWWLHLLFLLSFLVYVPQSKHAHLIAGPANVFLSRLDSKGKLEKSILPMRRKKATASERLKTSAALSLSTFTPASNAAAVQICVRPPVRANALADGPHFKAQRPFDGKRRCRDVKISAVPAPVFQHTKANQLAAASSGEDRVKRRQPLITTRA